MLEIEKISDFDTLYFEIKTVQRADDFASMKEVVTRRYSRLLREKNVA